MPERAVDVSNQGWRQQEYLHLGIGDLNQALAKIDLSCLPGTVSNRIVARACPANARRYGATARSIVRRLTKRPLLAINSWRTMSPLPRWRSNLSPASSLLPVKSVSARRLLLVGPPGVGLDVALDRLRRSQACAQATRTKTQLLQPEQGRYPPGSSIALPPQCFQLQAGTTAR